MALTIARDHDVPGVPVRFESYLKTAAMKGYAKAQFAKTGDMAYARGWFVNALACEDDEAGIEAARMLLADGEEAEAYPYAHYAATDLAALSPDKRNKGFLFMTGKSGAELYAMLKQQVQEKLAGSAASRAEG